MYECAYCGSDEGGYPAVIIVLNNNMDYNIPGNSDWDGLHDKIYWEFKRNPETIGLSDSELIALVWDKFYLELGKRDLWFCTDKCARKYLKHRKSEWELNNEHG